MICLSWNRPSEKEQAHFLARCKDGDFNYDIKFKEATRESPLLTEKAEKLKKDGYVINHARVRLGSGREVFVEGKKLLQSWGHFQLPWASVEAHTPITEGTKFCVCAHEVATWIMNPLQVLYVDSKEPPTCMVSKALSTIDPNQAAFAFGSGTLQGHLLAGEERFGVEWRDDDSVWYEILSFSKPAHFLSVAGYPIVRFQQKMFAKHSTAAMMRAVEAAKEQDLTKP